MAQKYTVELDIKNFDQNVQKLLQQLKELQKTLDHTNVNTQKFSKTSNEGSMSFTKMAGAVGLGVSAYSLLSSAISKSIQFMKDSVKVAMEEEKDQSRLYNALDRNIDAYSRMSEFKDQLIRTTTFSKDEIDSSINMALELGRTEEQTKKMILAAQGLSKVTGKDLSTSMQVLSATFEGSIGKLGKYSSEIKKLTQDQLKNGEAVDIIAKKFGIFAKEGVNTASGSIDRYNKSMEELQNNIGKKSLPLIKDLYEGLTKVVDKLNDWSSSSLVETTENEKKRINELVSEITSLNEGIEIRKTKLEELKSQYPQYFQNINTETIKNGELNNMLNLVNISLNEKIRLMGISEYQTGLSKNMKEQEEKVIESLKKIDNYYNFIQTMLQRKKIVDNPVVTLSLTGDDKVKAQVDLLRKYLKSNPEWFNDDLKYLDKWNNSYKDGLNLHRFYKDKFDKSEEQKSANDTPQIKDLKEQDIYFNKSTTNLQKRNELYSKYNKIKTELDSKLVTATNNKNLEEQKNLKLTVEFFENTLKSWNSSIQQLTPIYDPKKAKEAYDEQQKQNQLRNDNIKKTLDEEKKLKLENEKILINNLLSQNELLIQNEKDKSNVNLETLKKYYKDRDNLIQLATNTEIENYQKQIDELNTLSIIQTMAGTLTDEEANNINLKIQNLINKINSSVAKGSASREDNEKKSAESIYNIYKEQVDKISKLTEEKPTLVEGDFSGNAAKLSEYQNQLIEQKTLLLQKQLEIQNDSTKSDKEKVDALDAVNKALKTNSTEFENNTKSISQNIKQNLENIANVMQDIFSKMGLSAPIQQLGNDILNVFKTLEDSSLSAEERTKKITENIKQLAIDTAGAISDVIINGMLKDNQRQFESSLESLDKQFEAENEKLEKLHKAKIIDDTTYNKRKKANEEKRAKEEEELKKKKAKSDWEAAIIQSLINTALAVTMTLATAGIPAGVPLAIVAAALGLIETGLIIAQGPAYEKGGLVKKELGGLLQGPSHAQGGIPIVAEGNEYIIKKSVVQQPGMLNYLEKINNGEGVVGQQVSVIDQNSLKTIVEEVVLRTASIPVINVESESTRVQRKVQTIESKSSW